MFQAVIFDMDGVLIDSEPLYVRELYQMLCPNYPWITEESLYPQVGMSFQEFGGFMAELCRRDSEDENFQKELQNLFHDLELNYRTIMRPQVPMMLEKLREMNVQIALASSSPMSNIKKVLSDCEIQDYFEFIISGESFKKSKPDPEIYRVTMEHLGRTPEECLVVEDSTYGIIAGMKAGAIVAALRDDRFSFRQELATICIESLEEVPEIVGRERNFLDEE